MEENPLFNPFLREVANKALLEVQTLVDMMHFTGKVPWSQQYQRVLFQEQQAHGYNTNDFVVIPAVEDVLKSHHIQVNNKTFRPSLRQGVLLLVLGKHAHHWARRRQFSPSQGSLLTEEDIRNLPNLVSKLVRRRDNLSRFLWEQLSKPTKELVEEYRSTGQKGDQLLTALVDDLNRITAEVSLLEERLLDGVSLSGETNYVVRQKESDTRRIWFNRSILADAYDRALVRIPSSFLSIGGFLCEINRLNRDSGLMVWRNPQPEDVIRTVHTLRTVLEKAGLQPGLVETGHGYRISTPPWNIMLLGDPIDA